MVNKKEIKLLEAIIKDLDKLEIKIEEKELF